MIEGIVVAITVPRLSVIDLDFCFVNELAPDQFLYSDFWIKQYINSSMENGHEDICLKLGIVSYTSILKT